MNDDAQVVPIPKFLGLVNTTDEEKQPLGAMTVAENIMISSAGTVFRRDGNVRTATGTNITGSYGTSDGRYMFIIDNGTLFHFDAVAFTPLLTGLPIAPSYWCEESTERVFLISGAAYLYIDHANQITNLSNVKPVPNELNDLAFQTEGFPTIGVKAMTYHNGSVVLAVQVSEGVTRIQMSVPGQYHVFPLVHGRFELPDEVVGLESSNGQLLIVGKHSIYSYAGDSGLRPLLAYGAVPGKPITKLPDGSCIIATTRGLVTFPGAQNVTEQSYSYAPGLGCSTALYEIQGEKYILICTDGGGVPYNSV